MKNAFDGLNTDEYRISELEDVSIKSFKMKRKEKKDFKIQNFQGLWDNYKRYNMNLMRAQAGEETEKGKEEYLK